MVMNLRVWGFLLFCFILITGCQTSEDTAKLENQGENNRRFMQVSDPDDNENEKKSNTEIAEHLAEVASRVPEVNSASAIVAGPYTVVAIDVKGDIDRSRVGTIKYTVSEALYHDPWGKTAVVIADADIMERLRGMGDKIQQGYPIRGVVDELAAIVARFMPEFPVVDDQPIEPDSNKKMLDDGERKQLEEIEEEQSNHKIE